MTMSRIFSDDQAWPGSQTSIQPRTPRPAGSCTVTAPGATRIGRPGDLLLVDIVGTGPLEHDR